MNGIDLRCGDALEELKKEDMQMRLTAEMVNAAVFTPRELQTTRLWPMVPDDAENVLYADNVPMAWEGGKVE